MFSALFGLGEKVANGVGLKEEEELFNGDNREMTRQGLELLYKVFEEGSGRKTTGEGISMRNF